MADFCKQCSIENFGQDLGDLKDLLTEEDTKNGLVSSPVICEGCGIIQANHLGECVSEDCMCNGHKSKVEETKEGEANVEQYKF